jgi:murein DD-endopeptidase MepM/ murein hydrolase activator NlpD
MSRTSRVHFRRTLTVLLLLGVFTVPASAQVVFGGIFRQSSEPRAAWIGDEWPAFQKKWQELEKQGLRIFQFKTYMDGGKRKYAGLFKPGSYTPLAYVGRPWDDFLQHWQQFEKQNYRMIDFETWSDNGQRLYAGIFAPATYTPAAYVGKPWDDFLKQWQKFEKEGYRIFDFETYVEGGQRLYAGLFRPGNYAPAAYIGKPWDDFLAKWQDFEKQGYRMQIFRTYVDHGQRLYAGIFEPGNDARGAWIGKEYENFVAKWHDFEKQGLRLQDLEIYESPCDKAQCMNTVVMPPCPGGCNPYVYYITGSSTHCAGLPETCAGNTAAVPYSWPVDVDSGNRYIHLGALDIHDQFLTLPMMNKPGRTWSKNGWRYGDGTWHHAIDFDTVPQNTFEVVAAADGKVLYIGWDWWSGNTMVISHTVGGVEDAYRTIYMHLRNGASTDCDNAWNITIPAFSAGDPNLAQYKSYLNASGCTQNKATRNLKLANWGSNEKLDMSLVGKNVSAGQQLAWAGQTGPGGGRDPGGAVNTHVHVFFAHRDPADKKFYFFDPYGIYATPDCYPSGITDPLNNACVRYPVVWKGAKPQFH